MSLRFPKHPAHANTPSLPPREHAAREERMAASRGDEDLHAEILDLTVPQFRLLRGIQNQPYFNPGPLVMRRMDALTERGLVELRNWRRYVLTDHGRREIARAIPDLPWHLRKGDGLTTSESNAELEEGEVVDPTAYPEGWHWARESAERQAGSASKKDRARRLRDGRRAA